MATCSCAGATCNCVLTPGSGVTITGAGSAANPYVINAAGGGSGGGGRIPGEIVEYGGSVIPPGWLLCDGQAVSRTAFPDLFTAIGTTWGIGDGVTTFNVPNKLGRVGLGATSARPLGSAGGSDKVTIPADALPPHLHSIGHNHPMPHTHSIAHNHGKFNTAAGGSHDHALFFSNSTGGAQNHVPEGQSAGSGTNAGPVQTGGAHAHSIDMPNFNGNSGQPSTANVGAASTTNSGKTGNGASMTVLPPYAATNFIIKT